MDCLLRVESHWDRKASQWGVVTPLSTLILTLYLLLLNPACLRRPLVTHPPCQFLSPFPLPSLCLPTTVDHFTGPPTMPSCSFAFYSQLRRPNQDLPQDESMPSFCSEGPDMGMGDCRKDQSSVHIYLFNLSWNLTSAFPSANLLTPFKSPRISPAPLFSRMSLLIFGENRKYQGWVFIKSFHLFSSCFRVSLFLSRVKVILCPWPHSLLSPIFVLFYSLCSCISSS